MHTIDATGKKIGRVATEAAVFLMGKNKVSFRRNVVSGEKVSIINAGKLSISEKKKDGKIYKRYSGYPGGLKETSLGELLEKKGAREVLRKAVHGMLPGNRLRPRMMKNLEINE